VTFKVGNMVDVKGINLPVYGKITKLKGQEVTVLFKVPNREKRKGYCDSCGMWGGLSVNAGTGEIVCMMTGCGHEYGFHDRKEIVRLYRLTNITARREREKRRKQKQAVH